MQKSINGYARLSMVAALCALATFVPERGFGQLTAQIVGTITDATEAVVLGAEVTVQNVDTGIEWKVTSNQSGYYTVPLLQPGNYEVTVQLEGFRTVSRLGIRLDTAQTATLDFTLEIGVVTERVEVTGTAPLLDTGTNAIGGLIAGDKVENLPTKGRNTAAFMMLVPGVRITRATTNGPAINSSYQFFSVNGARPSQNQFYMDGGSVSNAGFNGPDYSGQVEAVEEFKVQTNNYGAEHTNAAGGVINIVTKGGTNELHGSAFDYLRNDALGANNFFSNRAGRDKPSLRYNQFGGTVGGPIIKDRTFFFFGYEGLQRSSPFVRTLTVPTSLQKQGDFSDTLARNGKLVTVYDPTTTRQSPDDPKKFIRDPFPGNVVPAARLNAVGTTASQFYPAPNQPGLPNSRLNNYFFAGSTKTTKNDYSIRTDHHATSTFQITGRYSFDYSTIDPPGEFGEGNPANALGSNLVKFKHYAPMLKFTKTFSPTLFGEFVSSFTRWHFDRSAGGNNFDPTELGFPASLAANSLALGFPRLSPAGMAALGNTRFVEHAYDRFEWKANMTKIAGKHTLKFGGLAGVPRQNVRLLIQTTGVYSFGTGFTQGPDPFRSSRNAGFGYATFLLGTPSSGRHNGTELHTANTSKYVGFYLQDDFKVNPKLTLNLGIRYDYDSPRTERRDEIANFDFDETATLDNGAVVRGGTAFPGVGGLSRGHWEPDKNNVSPRFGFAYRLDDKMVLRGGYGIFFSQSNGSGINGQGIPPTGFICQTPLTISLDGGLTPAVTLSNPFPDGYCEVTRNTAGILTNLGQNIQYIDRNHQTPKGQQWNFDIQRTLPGDVLFEVAYAGSRGLNLIGTLEGNQLAPEHLSLGTELNRKVANPFFGEIQQGPLAAATITTAQSLRPFPQFLTVSDRAATYGASTYHAMMLKVERRFARGFSILGSYTWSKLIDDVPASVTGFPGEQFARGRIQNYYDRGPERSLATFDTPQNLVISYVWELPFGAGKRFLTGGGVVNKLVGGWQINGITHFMSGAPLQITGGNSSGSLAGTQRPHWTGQDASLSGDISDRIGAYFDKSVFTRNEPFTFGSAPRTMPNLRAPGVQNFDISIFKNTNINERIRTQFRVEFFNAFNRAQFAFPNTNFNSNAFGVIRGQANSPRDIQLALKLFF